MHELDLEWPKHIESQTMTRFYIECHYHGATNIAHTSRLLSLQICYIAYYILLIAVSCCTANLRKLISRFASWWPIKSIRLLIPIVESWVECEIRFGSIRRYFPLTARILSSGFFAKILYLTFDCTQDAILCGAWSALVILYEFVNLVTSKMGARILFWHDVWKSQSLDKTFD